MAASVSRPRLLGTASSAVRRAAAGSLAAFALVLSACSSSTPHGGRTPPPPRNCVEAHCTTAGTIRFSVPLGVAMNIARGEPAYYVTPRSRTRPHLGAVGSSLVVGWDETVLATDVHTGALRWRSATVVAPRTYVTDVHAAGPIAAVGVQPLTGGGTGYEYLLDPSTGKVRLRLPARDGEGVIWGDSTSVIAIEPTALVRVDLSSGKDIWSVPLPPRVTAAKQLVAAVVAGSRVLYSVAGKAAQAVDAATGMPAVAAPLGQVVGDRLVGGTPAQIRDLEAGRVVWTGPAGSAVEQVDHAAHVVYWAPAGSSTALHAVRLGDGKAAPVAGSLGRGMHDDLLAVHAGAAVYEQTTSGSDLPTSTYFVAFDTRSGHPRWSSYTLPNLFYAPTAGPVRAGGIDEADGFVGGFTCAKTATVAAASDPSGKLTCPDVEVTLVNI